MPAMAGSEAPESRDKSLAMLTTINTAKEYHEDQH